MAFVSLFFFLIYTLIREEDLLLSNLEREILQEQSLVTKRAKEFEVPKVGFAAIQEMARKQEELLLRDVEEFKMEGPGKFPLDVSTPKADRKFGTPRLDFGVFFIIIAIFMHSSHRF